MTIITNAKEKKDNELNKAKAKEAFGGDAPVDGQPTGIPINAWAEDGNMDWYVNWRRRRLLSSLCAGLLVLWLLLASVVGGVLLFRYVHRRPVFYGWCGTQYEDRSFGASRYEKLQERVQVDPNAEIEKIEVPKFGPNRPAVFVHDFKQNLTAIVDVVGGQCFLKPLDRSHVSPPDSFIDLINKMESGYYEQNTEVVRSKFKAVLPPLTPEEIEEEGSFMIADQCRGSLTFRLQPDFSSELLARPQIDDPIPEDLVHDDDPFLPANQASRIKRDSNVPPSSFRYFSGKQVVIYDIV